MKTKSLFTLYTVLGIMGVITTQGLPVVYASYGLDSNQIYNLISIVFLATAFQPIIGMIIDKFFTHERGISMMFGMVAITGLALVFVNTYPVILYVILIFSIFRVPLFALMDGYSAGQVEAHNINMGLVRAGSTVGFGLGLTSLMIFLNVFNLSPSYTFLYIAILALASVVLIEYTMKKGKGQVVLSERDLKPSIVDKPTNRKLVAVLVAMQIAFFGFSILKISYTTPFLVEYGYSNQVIAATTVIGMIPIFILMPLFGKVFSKFKLTTILSVGIITNIVQTSLYLLFPTNVAIIYFGTFLNGFIFPLYTPVFGMLLRKALSPKVIATGFTTIFTMQNLFVFFFNQFIIIHLLNTSGTVATAYQICLGFYLISLIPVAILRFKQY